MQKNSPENLWENQGYSCQTTSLFIVHSQSSIYLLRAVLYQRQDGIEKVIAYARKELRSADRNNTAQEYEFLALKYVI